MNTIKISVAVFFCVLIQNSFSQKKDAVYMSGGGQLYPLNETNITIEKEMINFVVRDKICSVEVQLEFMNPSSQDQKIMVGFQSPFASKIASNQSFKDSHIKNLVVSANGKDVAIQNKAISCDKCPMVSLESIDDFKDFKSASYVFLFEITFKPGMNIVKQSYSYYASTGITVSQSYDFNFKGTAKWGHGKIKDFQMSLDLGSNITCYVHDIFQNAVYWQIEGVGKVHETKKEKFAEAAQKRVRIVDGKLKIQVADFLPKAKIGFGIYNENSLLFPPEGISNKINIAMYYLQLSDIYDQDQPWTIQELVTLRNTLYAFHGLVFNNDEVDKYFQKFDWYYPNPNIKKTEIKLTSAQRRFLDEIAAEEKRQKG